VSICIVLLDQSQSGEQSDSSDSYPCASQWYVPVVQSVDETVVQGTHNRHPKMKVPTEWKEITINMGVQMWVASHYSGIQSPKYIEHPTKSGKGTQSIVNPRRYYQSPAKEPRIHYIIQSTILSLFEVFITD